jgi:hypothetical protein
MGSMEVLFGKLTDEILGTVDFELQLGELLPIRILGSCSGGLLFIFLFYGCGGLEWDYFCSFGHRDVQVVGQGLR